MDAYQLYYLVQQAREHTCLDAARLSDGYLVETDLYPLQRQLMCSSWIDILIHNYYANIMLGDLKVLNELWYVPIF